MLNQLGVVCARQVDARNAASLSLAAFAILLVALTGEAAAQTTNLGSIAGQTALQTRGGDAVQTVCGGLGAAGTVADDGSDVGDLFGRCRELVQTGNAVNASGGATAFDLGLNAAQLNDALLEVAHEESAAQGTSVTEVGTPAAGNVAVRIAELQGGATGFNVAALKMNVSGYSVPVASVMPGEAGAASGQEAMEFSRLGGFVNGSFGFGEFDGSDEEAGFDFDTSPTNSLPASR